VYGLKDETFRELGGPQTWSVVQGADFSHTRAPIRTVNQAPGDGHCCPTGEDRQGDAAGRSAGVPAGGHLEGPHLKAE
jgi:hypothetical protein